MSFWPVHRCRTRRCWPVRRRTGRPARRRVGLASRSTRSGR